MSCRRAVTLSCGDKWCLGATHIGPDPSRIELSSEEGWFELTYAGVLKNYRGNARDGMPVSQKSLDFLNLSEF